MYFLRGGPLDSGGGAMHFSEKNSLFLICSEIKSLFFSYNEKNNLLHRMLKKNSLLQQLRSASNPILRCIVWCNICKHCNKIGRTTRAFHQSSSIVWNIWAALTPVNMWGTLIECRFREMHIHTLQVKGFWGKTRVLLFQIFPNIFPKSISYLWHGYTNEDIVFNCKSRCQTLHVPTEIGK